MSTSPISVLLADDHSIVREGFKSVLGAQSDIVVVGEADSGRLAVELAQKFGPAVVVMDIGMPVLNGIEATRQICEELPATKVIILSAYNDDDYLDRVLASGAVGYLLKGGSTKVLPTAIREVAAGGFYLDDELARRRNSSPAGNHAGGHKPARINLSSREAEVLQLIAEGAANKNIAKELNLSIKTIEKHRQRLMDKLHIHNTAGLTRYALVRGVIEGRTQLNSANA
jgi:DNA-binding NarL/FixJ family response regulator